MSLPMTSSIRPRSSASSSLPPRAVVAEPLWGTAALEANRETRRAQQRAYATKRDSWIRSNQYCYDSVTRLLRSIVEPGKAVLELRSLSGYLLNALAPSRGLGVEDHARNGGGCAEELPRRWISCALIPNRSSWMKNLHYVVFSNLSDTVDICCVRRPPRVVHADPPDHITIHFLYWHTLLEVAMRVGLRMPLAEPNWLSTHDVKGFLRLAGFECVASTQAVLLPKRIPLVSEFFNRIVAPLPGVRALCMVEMIVARPAARPRNRAEISVSWLCRAGTSATTSSPLFAVSLKWGGAPEIVFCDDHSTDGTGDEVRRLQQSFPLRDIRLVEGPGICKAENVWTGFRAARGDVLMILDGDLAVMPEELPYFFDALVEGTGEFIDGSRLVYPMQRGAMKGANLIGNKLFSLVFSFLLDQRIKDTLCGTKVLWRKDWQRIERLLGTWGVQDLWGDYELLFGSSLLQLSIRDLPCSYQERIHGVTKMRRVFANGLRMLRMCWAAWWKLKGRF